MRNLLKNKNFPIVISALYALSRGTTLIGSDFGKYTNWFHIGVSIVSVLIGVAIIFTLVTEKTYNISIFLGITYIVFTVLFSIYGLISFQVFTENVPVDMKATMFISSAIAFLIRLLIGYHLMKLLKLRRKEDKINETI